LILREHAERDMSIRWLRTTTIGVVAAGLMSCSAATEPHSDVDRARAAWLTGKPAAYSFEVESHFSMFPKSGYYRVQVSNGQVVSAVNPDGEPVTDFRLTIDRIWDSVLAARSRGELNSALFDHRGVPVEVDMGPWPVDGGVHYSVRNFAASNLSRR
jgi:hypothetical protein